MLLSPVGEIVTEEWQRSELLNLNVALDACIVMPNHIHRSVVINEAPPETRLRGVSTIAGKSYNIPRPIRLTEASLHGVRRSVPSLVNSSRFPPSAFGRPDSAPSDGSPASMTTSFAARRPCGPSGNTSWTTPRSGYSTKKTLTIRARRDASVRRSGAGDITRCLSPFAPSPTIGVAHLTPDT